MTKLTLKQAVKQNCLDCIYDRGMPGTHIQQIENCQITKCALHEHRPITAKTKAKAKQAVFDALPPEKQREILSENKIKREALARALGRNV